MRDDDNKPRHAESSIPSPDIRLSIWTIRAKWIGWFYLLFTLHAVPLIYALWWSENYSGAHGNIASTITAVFGGSASLIFVAATASVVELEVIMVLKHLLEKREAEKIEQRIREAYEKGRQDEREAQNTARRKSSDRNGAEE